ncbi:hypothetical protein KAR91_88045 [Candidatus Pacearchaeota archaeon]|nr:hypothetical protein [Candidatus Pacearchaeota archaeon]
MGNFHTPPTDSTKWRVSDVAPLFAQLDKGITYLKNIIIHCDGDVTYNSTTGVLDWTGILRVLFNRTDGYAIQNTIAIGDITLADNEFAYVDLNETNDSVLTVAKAAVTTAAASNFITFNRLVLGYRNTTSDEYFPVYLNIPAAGDGVTYASIGEMNTGTEAAKAASPDNLAGSHFGERGFNVALVASNVDVAVSDGIYAFCVPAALAGMNIVNCVATVHTAGTTGTTDIQIRRRRDTTDVDVLSTKLTIDSGETSSITAATEFVVNAANDDLVEGDLLFVDIDAISTTAPKGLFVTVMAQLP